MVLQRLDARVTILGDLAVTELEQSFFNPAADTVEGLYTLTVPRGAVLQRFAVDRRGRLVDGVVQERAAAAAAYQAQVYRGSPFDPALLEWDAPGTYHARLFPLQPASTRRIVVTYTQWLPTGPDGLRSYRLPLAGLGTRIGELRAHIDLERSPTPPRCAPPPGPFATNTSSPSPAPMSCPRATSSSSCAPPPWPEGHPRARPEPRRRRGTGPYGRLPRPGGVCAGGCSGAVS
jgi:hypothetical protein